MKKILWLTLAVPAVFYLCGCKETGLEEPENRSDGTVTFIIGNDSVETKTPVQSAVYDLESDGLSIIETVSSMDGSGPGTKGTPIYTENFDALYGSELYATAYVPKSGTVALTDAWGSYLENGGTVKLQKAGANTYHYDYSKGQKVNLAWPSGGSLLYFLQAPYEKTKSVSPVFYSDGHIEFDYIDPAYDAKVSTKEIANGAAKQSDILFSSKLVSKPAEGQSKNSILMYHALAAVKFQAGNNDMEVETRITKVSFKGLKAGGHCTIKPNYSNDNVSPENPSNADGASATKSSNCVVWSNHTLDINYSQTIDDAVLNMVPQELKDVEVTVDFTINGKPFTRSLKMSGTWKAGELHTYTLTVNKVDVSISDNMNDALTEKTGVTTTNSGNVVAYLRATYALAWYYGYGNDAICVASYQGNGEFGYLGGPNDKDGYKLTWIKGSDGFYYYTWPVMPGRATRFPFFNKFTAPAISEKGPFPGSHLEMNILLQGVQYDAEKVKVTQAWGDVFTVDEKGKPTTTKIVDVLSADIENISL